MRTLFKKIFGGKTIRCPRLPAGLRVYAVGDIHGRADLLERLHAEIARDAAVAPADRELVVYLGDYLDRGTAVRDTIDTLLHGLPSRLRAIHLRGNHEFMFSDFLDHPASLPAWLDQGGAATLHSYLVRPPQATECGPATAQEVRSALLASIPQSHLDFLRTRLRTMLRLGDYVFVHAGLRPGVALEHQREEDMLWIRDEFLSSTHGRLRVVHGHTIHNQPEARPHRIAVDTGAYATGVLSCAVLEEDRVHFISTGKTP